jgi:hypothetical protein
MEQDMTKDTPEIDPVFVRLQKAQAEYLAALQETWEKILQQYAQGCAGQPPGSQKAK